MGKFKSKKNQDRNDPFLIQLTEDKSVRGKPRQKDPRSGSLTEQATGEVLTWLLTEHF